MNKAEAINIYKENLDIFKKWCFISPSGRVITLPDKDKHVPYSKVYSEPFCVDDKLTFSSPTSIKIEETDCLSAVKDMKQRGLNPVILSFANAYYPCGLYEDGAPYREEELCRVSTLSLKLNYQAERNNAYPLDMRHGAIYSDVVVFREGMNGCFKLLEEPYLVGIISAGALNLRSNIHHPRIVQNLEYAMHGEEAMTAEGKDIMQEKIRTIFRVARANGHDSIVIGAWGCGINKQRPSLIARMFMSVADELEFRRKFREIYSAIENHKHYVQYARAIEGNRRFNCDDRPAYFCFKVGNDRIWGAEYPGDHIEKVAAEKVKHAIDFGITHFIDLTQEGELPPYTQYLPHDGSVVGVRFPIKDASAPSSHDDVRQLVRKMHEILINPHARIYLHCWGGVGRTGTIAACWLATEYGYDYYTSMSKLQHMWKTCLKSEYQAIPDHWSQKEFIKSYVDYIRDILLMFKAKEVLQKTVEEVIRHYPDYTHEMVVTEAYNRLCLRFHYGDKHKVWSDSVYTAQETNFIQQLINKREVTLKMLSEYVK